MEERHEPTAENIAALIFPICIGKKKNPISEQIAFGRRVPLIHTNLVTKVKETNGETTEDDGEMEP